ALLVTALANSTGNPPGVEARRGPAEVRGTRTLRRPVRRHSRRGSRRAWPRRPAAARGGCRIPTDSSRELCHHVRVRRALGARAGSWTRSLRRWFRHVWWLLTCRPSVRMYLTRFGHQLLSPTAPVPGVNEPLIASSESLLRKPACGGVGVPALAGGRAEGRLKPGLQPRAESLPEQTLSDFASCSTSPQTVAALRSANGGSIPAPT